MSEHRGAAPDEASLPQLLEQMTQQLTVLVRDEIALARTELKESAQDGAAAVGLFGAGGVTALYGVGALVATLILLLDLVLPAWAAAAIVTALLFAAAGAAALAGKSKAGQVTPPLDGTPDSLRADVEALKGGDAR